MCHRRIRASCAELIKKCLEKEASCEANGDVFDIHNKTASSDSSEDGNE
jgi:hypothetical protein